MKDFSFFPQLMFAIISFIVGVVVIPQLLAPYLPAVLLVIAFAIISWLAARSKKRNRR